MAGKNSKARNGKTKKEWLAEEIAKAVGAGRPVTVETVDFSDPNRPPTCLEVDFPILPINQIAAIEGNAGKPIYQMSKWWARRRSSVFRAMLLAASMKAPEDPAEAAKAVWDVYYANHQKKEALSHLKVADIFMGGGTTIVEGSRLGMQMFGCDLNPVAWFVVKNELAKVDAKEVEALLADIEAEVKPQVMPFYACDCPRGHKGKWTRVSTGEIMGEDFDPLALTPEERKDYMYAGPEIIYVFWSKHGPCQVTGCGHRTPIMSSPVMAVKTLTVKAWEKHECVSCGELFDEERDEVRMAPGVPLVVAEDEKPYAVLNKDNTVICPHCGQRQNSKGMVNQRWTNKKVSLHLLVLSQWLAGSPNKAPDGTEYGGSVTDSFEATVVWSQERASKIKLIEIRGTLPEEINCPETGVVVRTDERGGTVPYRINTEGKVSPVKGAFICKASTCGQAQDVLKSVYASRKTAPVAAYAIQGYCPACDREGRPYGGCFFSAASNVSRLNAAGYEWTARRDADLNDYWPRGSKVRSGLETSIRTPLHKYHYYYWSDFFNSRQLIVHSLLLKTITTLSGHPIVVKELVMSGFQQYLRSNNMFCLWHISKDHFAPFLSKNNLQPPNRPIENNVFHGGYGSWLSCQKGVVDSILWAKKPWEILTKEYLKLLLPKIAEEIGTKSVKIEVGDSPSTSNLYCKSSTDLDFFEPSTFDLVITDPPFGDIEQYAELSDFLYVWLRLGLKSDYSVFSHDYTPVSLEAVENKARHGTEASCFYKRILTVCWSEASRILKTEGILAFTFHHDKDGPWIAVLESLFDAGFYLEAAYPVRSDETKGEGSKPGTYGAQKVEYDIIHVCRKRTEEPTPISWGKMRREVLRAVRQLKEILEIHIQAGLPAADLQVIKRGKALEYYSRHYGKVYVDEGKPISVRDAIMGINQLLDEESGSSQDPPPVTAEPFTRQFLRIFDATDEQPRDQMQKYLRGTGISPTEFVERGWCKEEKKVYCLTSPLNIARNWYGKYRQNLISDYDQAMFLIGACFDGSGIKVNDTLNNKNFRPHPALGALLDWHSKRGSTQEIRTAAVRALQIYQTWERQHKEQVEQLALFFWE